MQSVNLVIETDHHPCPSQIVPEGSRLSQHLLPLFLIHVACVIPYGGWFLGGVAFLLRLALRMHIRQCGPASSAL